MNLDKIIGGNIREIVSGNLLDTLVRDTNRALTYTTEDSERERATVELKDGRGRSAIVQDVVMLSRQELEDTFGIELIDVDIKQLNYTKSAQDATIRQMISEREKVAASYEAQGRKEADTIAGETQGRGLGLAVLPIGSPSDRGGGAGGIQCGESTSVWSRSGLLPIHSVAGIVCQRVPEGDIRLPFDGFGVDGCTVLPGRRLQH